MSSEPAASARTYGGWRRSRSMGLWGLGPAHTLVVLGAILAVVAAGSISAAAMAVAAVPATGVVALLVARWNGTPLLSALSQQLRWAWGQARGRTSYRAGVTADGPHAWMLPGVLAATELLAVDDAAGPFGLVRHRRSGTLTATLRVAPTSTWLVDRDQSDAWVANWGAWLAGLGYQPMVRWAAITVTALPASSVRLPSQLAAQLVPGASAAAAHLLRRVASSTAETAAEVRTEVSITFDPAGTATKLDADAVAEVTRQLPGLESALGSCGLTLLGRATAPELAAIVRSSFDPGARDDLERLDGADQRLVDWATAGPIAADEEYGRYRHDSGLSVSWAWQEAPRQHVHAEVLARLLAPTTYRKRVTLVYRPLAAAEAAKVVDREVNAAVFRSALRAAQRRDANARDRADHDRALRAAGEEAVGAGIGLMSLFVTVTALHPDELDGAVADVEARADVARIRLRRLWASQAAGFATTLPCGLCPAQLATTWPR
ncbi:SCO6880 family protein [Cryptosporangium sp. NPDC051539]|uniref:SCO6880 family protein n=1 Tax=Cryptosporangium sp. NPDC051539 TaxID=3363962 RepID=UPI003792B36C